MKRPLLRQLHKDPHPARILTDRAVFMNTPELLVRIKQTFEGGARHGQGN